MKEMKVRRYRLDFVHTLAQRMSASNCLTDKCILLSKKEQLALHLICVITYRSIWVCFGKSHYHKFKRKFSKRDITHYTSSIQSLSQKQNHGTGPLKHFVMHMLPMWNTLTFSLNSFM